MTTYEDEYAPMATMADAHREWHLNAGVPMGTAGCPQDACHPVDEYDDYDAVAIMCGHCKRHHYGERSFVLAAIRACYQEQLDNAELTRMAR